MLTCYDQPMRLSFVGRTRPELKFDSVDQLIAQLHKDEAEITAILS
jgi:FAD synthase